MTGPAPLAALVAGADSLEAAHLILAETGLVTELEYERRRVAESATGAPSPTWGIDSPAG